MRRSLSIRYQSGTSSIGWHHRPSIIERNAAFTSAGSSCSASQAPTLKAAIDGSSGSIAFIFSRNASGRPP